MRLFEVPESSLEKAFHGVSGHAYRMGRPCTECGDLEGVLSPRGGQNCVFCASCNRFVYNAPKAEVWASEQP